MGRTSHQTRSLSHHCRAANTSPSFHYVSLCLGSFSPRKVYVFMWHIYRSFLRWLRGLFPVSLRPFESEALPASAWFPGHAPAGGTGLSTFWGSQAWSLCGPREVRRHPKGKARSLGVLTVQSGSCCQRRGGGLAAVLLLDAPRAAASSGLSK